MRYVIVEGRAHQLDRDYVSRPVTVVTLQASAAYPLDWFRLAGIGDHGVPDPQLTDFPLPASRPNCRATQVTVTASARMPMVVMFVLVRMRQSRSKRGYHECRCSHQVASCYGAS